MEIVSEILYIIFIVAYIYTVVSSIIVVLLENKHPVRTTAWILVLVFLPLIGLFLYFLFGRSFQRQRKISKKIKRKIHSRIDYYAAEEKCLEGCIPENQKRLIKLLRKSSDAAIFSNTEIEIYTDGKILFKDMLEEMDKATHNIHAEYYAVETDETGNLFKDMLIKKAQQGLEVRLIYDDVGSWRLKRSTIQEMQKAGVKLESFFKLRFPYFTNKLNYRNHRKILVIDGNIGFLGGFNIADRYTKGLEWGNWRDTHIKLRGNGVAGLQSVFVTDWLYMTKKLIFDKNYSPITNSEHNSHVQIVGSGPDSTWQGIMQGFCHAIQNAQKYVYVQTPYFLPNESIGNALECAALSGIDVRIMIPSRSDVRLSLEASFSFVRSMLAAGVKVYLYQDGFIHAKSIAIDDELAIIGSANMDFRSFDQNFEISAFIYDKGKSVELKDIFLKDLKHCKRLQYSIWKHRPFSQKLIQSFARLFIPIL